jgi:NAD-dependent SIR2 family protein deacetylase
MFHYIRRQEIVKESDILLVIGTSLQVYPAAGLIHDIKDDCLLIVINPNENRIWLWPESGCNERNSDSGNEVVI